MIRLWCFLPAALIVWVGCSASPPQAPADEPVAAAAVSDTCQSEKAQAQFPDDHHWFHRVAGAAKGLVRGRKNVPCAKLVEQLSRPQCRLRLQPRNRERLTPAAIYRKWRNSVVVMANVDKVSGRAGIKFATGFVIGDSDIVVTNAHVVNNPKGVVLLAMVYNGHAHVVKEVLAASISDDVAICRLDRKCAKLAPIPLGPAPTIGSPVAVISHPNHRFYTLTTGIVSRYARVQMGSARVPCMEITADYALGSSGAPVFDAGGNVVGIAARTHSIYHPGDQARGKEDQPAGNLQMVVKLCVPVVSIRKLIAEPPDAKAP